MWDIDVLFKIQLIKKKIWSVMEVSVGWRHNWYLCSNTHNAIRVSKNPNAGGLHSSCACF